MLVVKNPERDGGWSFTFKLTGDEFSKLSPDEYDILFAAKKAGAKRYPVSALLLVLFSFAKRVELKRMENSLAKVMVAAMTQKEESDEGAV